MLKPLTVKILFERSIEQGCNNRTKIITVRVVTLTCVFVQLEFVRYLISNLKLLFRDFVHQLCLLLKPQLYWSNTRLA